VCPCIYFILYISFVPQSRIAFKEWDKGQMGKKNQFNHQQKVVFRRIMEHIQEAEVANTSPPTAFLAEWWSESL